MEGKKRTKPRERACRGKCTFSRQAGRNMQYKICDCTVIDVENGCALLPHTDVYIRGGKIEKIVPSGEKAQADKDGHGRADGYKTVNGAGKFAVPGLVNLHVHLFGTGRPSKALGGGKAQQRLLAFIHTALGRRILAAMVESSARNELLSGVTTLRAVGDLFGSDIALKRKTDAGKGAAAGLRMFVSGMAITAPGGHGAGTFARTAETPEEFEKLVEKNVSEGADFIKICITGGVMDAKKRGEPGEVKMTQAQVSAVCSRAHALGKKVAAHVQSKAGAELAAIGGVDTIEHGAPLTEESVRLLRKRKGAQVVTCSPALPCARLPHEVTKLGEAASYNSEVVMQGMIDGAAQAAAAGIAVGIGTDASCPFCTQYNMWREVLWFEKCMYISAAEALYTATLGNARILGVGDETGSIREGKSADILLLEGDPLADLTALRDIDCMFAKGRFISHPKPKRLPAIEAQLDRLTEEL